jgi:hypothetical protein
MGSPAEPAPRPPALGVALKTTPYPRPLVASVFSRGFHAPVTFAAAASSSLGRKYIRERSEFVPMTGRRLPSGATWTTSGCSGVTPMPHRRPKSRRVDRLSCFSCCNVPQPPGRPLERAGAVIRGQSRLPGPPAESMANASQMPRRSFARPDELARLRARLHPFPVQRIGSGVRGYRDVV